MAKRGSPASPAVTRGSPAVVLKMLQISAGYFSGIAASMERGSSPNSPARALQLLEARCASAGTSMSDANIGMQHFAGKQPEQMSVDSVDSNFDPDGFFKSSLPSSQESRASPQKQKESVADLPDASQESRASPQKQKKSLADSQKQSLPELQQESVADLQDAMHTDLPNELFAERDRMSCSQKRKFTRREFGGDEKSARYQRERQEKYKQDSKNCEEQIKEEHKRIIQGGRQTPQEVTEYLLKIEAKTEASKDGQKLINQIQTLKNIKHRNGTQRGQLHRALTKIRNLITAEKKQALEELSAQNAIMSFSESASDFCAPT